MKTHSASEVILCRLPFAHRGLFSNADGPPENTLGALVAARDAGFGAELDVSLTSDGEVVAFHDDTLDRLCGVPGVIEETPWERLRTLPILGSKESSPRLSDVLGAIDGRVPLVIELKSFCARKGFHRSGALETALLRVLDGYRGDVAFKSFNPHSVNALLDAGTSRPVGFLACDYARDGDFLFLSPADAKEHAELRSPAALRADFISYNIGDLDARLRAVRADVPFLVWTVRTAEQFEKARSLVDNVVFEWRGVKPERFRAAPT